VRALTPLRLLVLGTLLAAVVALVVGPTLVASGTTGSPAVTVNLGINSSGNLDVSGQYSDPDGVCDLFHRPITITTQTGSFSGPVVDVSTDFTQPGGTYSKNTTFTTTSGETYYVTVEVKGEVNGSYGGTDVCPDATGQSTITA
jgi:hypothetical protein